MTITIDEAVTAADREVDVVDLDDVLGRLAAIDERKGRVVELRLFAGSTIDETAAALGVSPTTIEGDWRVAKAWLRAELATEATA